MVESIQDSVATVFFGTGDVRALDVKCVDMDPKKWSFCGNIVSDWPFIKSPQPMKRVTGVWTTRNNVDLFTPLDWYSIEAQVYFNPLLRLGVGDVVTFVFATGGVHPTKVPANFGSFRQRVKRAAPPPKPPKKTAFDYILEDPFGDDLD